jgi:arabinofuranosyltransferase
MVVCRFRSYQVLIKTLHTQREGEALVGNRKFLKFCFMKTQNIFITASFVAFIALAYLYFPESIDDAYITLRYSKNLLLGNGPIFNIGERVEGYSNFSWMVLLAAFGWIGAPMEMAMKVLSLAAGLGVLVLVWKFSVNNFKSGLAITSAVVLLATSSFFAVWSVDGLETMFYTLLLTALVYCLTTDNASPLLIGVIAALTALTRPEGIMFSLIAVMYLMYKKGLIPGLKALAPVAIVAGGYELFRINYFGELVSNTAIAKVHWSFNKTLEGLQYLNTYNIDSGYLILPAALVGAVAFMKNPRLHIPIIFILAQIFFLMVSGRDFMYAYRFIIPVLPCLALLCASAIEIAYERLNRNFALIALTIIAGSQAFSTYAALPKKHIGFDNLTFRNSFLFEIAEFLAPRSAPNDWILLSEAGIIPYYVNANVRDYMGLASPYYSVYNENHAINFDYIFSANPKFLLISFVEAEDGSIHPRMHAEAQILLNPKFNSSYSAIQNFDFSRDTSFLNALYYLYSPKKIKRVFYTVFERTSNS